ncbi:MBL fold metallo-hydrolase [Isoptericola sp. b441]|uniref:MBL fold metallo-hydrolase n=1 Tax=Actinotalea lenta TaxID=3064654 RepID=A0ABT9DAZ9_9CELL|nr:MULTISPECIES: MBL fold metallo-hydrolase [unclassified Isoptericola]MDO8107740.1 MBL fold metallo-hydrolase [Isoptericola sp. b441]MDO8120589.1 MBL fold metallo-hydrolase [Isoptericola sp. b490]
MELSKWGHSCVRMVDHDVTVVIDPGGWSDVAGALDGADHVLVTHEHADHLAVDRVAAWLAHAPQAQVHGPAAALAPLEEAGVSPERLNAVQPGDRLDLNGLVVLVGGGTHAEIHPDVPRPANVGYLVGPVWHPGDSVDTPPEPARVLLVPAGAPWLRLADAVELVRAVRPELAIPIHDAIYSGQGTGLADSLLSRLGGAGEYRRTTSGETLTV